MDDTTEALSRDQFECERAKRECLVATAYGADEREACESTSRSSMEPVRAEKERVHDQCRAEREPVAPADPVEPDDAPAAPVQSAKGMTQASLPRVHWIEVDFPALIEHKRAVLEVHELACKLALKLARRVRSANAGVSSAAGSSIS